MQGGLFGGLGLYTTLTLILLTIIPASLFYVVYVTRSKIIYDKICSDGVKVMMIIILLTLLDNAVFHLLIQ